LEAVDLDNNHRWLTDEYWVTPFNFSEESRSQITLPPDNRVYMHDVTIREAEQAPGIVFTKEEKLAIAQALDRLGVFSLETFPIVSKDDMEVTRQIVDLKLRAKVICLARWLKEDIDAVADCGAYGVIVENVANPWTCDVMWGLTEDEIVGRFVEAVKYAKSLGLHTVAMPWDDFRVSISFLERLYKAIVFDGGADAIAISDTSGNSLPWTTTFLIRKLREWIPDTPIHMHAHNEFGLANAGMLAAVAGGASFVHTCINGLGSRGGNAATEEVAVALELLMGVSTGVRLDYLYPTCQLVSELAKTPIPRNKAIVGSNLFTYVAGLSVFMFEKACTAGRPYAYVPFVPQMVGREGYEIVLGKLSGKTAVRSLLGEMGIKLTDEQVSRLTELVKEEAIIRKSTISRQTFSQLANRILEKGV
jgi:isopropylmalate/homocitrate/citramalate synthase